jgi:hypothetical protein
MSGASARAALFLLIGVVAVALAGGAAWWFRSADTDQESRPAGTDAPRSTVPGALIAPPPFRVTGTLISSKGSTAIVVARNSDGSEQPEQKLTEGQTLEGYKLIAINMHRVYFEKGGARFLLMVGGGDPELLRAGARIPPQRARVPDMKILAPPSELERQKAQAGIEQLFEQMQQSPKVQERLKERRRQMEERQAQQDPARVPPGPSGPTPP